MEILSPRLSRYYVLPVLTRLPLLAFLTMSTAFADWIELKDGTRIDGSISSITAQQIVIEVQSTPTIREEKAYPRAEVAKFQRDAQDDVAFAEIAALQLPATVDDPAVYRALLDQKVRPFTEKFGYSKHMPAVRKLAAQIEVEQARVAAGEVKIDGQWVSAADLQTDGPETGGRLLLAKMKEASDPVVALVQFETLEKSSATSSVFPAAVRLARQKLQDLRPLVARMRADLQRREAEQAEGLQLASPDRRLILQRGIDMDRAAVESQLERAKQTGTKWPPLVPNAKTLDDLDKLTEVESARLAALNVDAMEQAMAAAQRAADEITAGNLDAAKENIASAEVLWSQYNRLASLRNELAKAMQAKPATP